MKINVYVSLILMIFIITGCGTTYNYGTEISGTITKSDKLSADGYYYKDFYFNTMPNTTYQITLTSSTTSLGVSVYQDGKEYYPRNAPASISFRSDFLSKSVYADIWITPASLTAAGNSASFRIKIDRQ